MRTDILLWPAPENSRNEWLSTFADNLRTCGFIIRGYRGIRDILRYKPMAIIVNWVESPMNKPAYIWVPIMTWRLTVYKYAKYRSVKLVWVVHNIGPHDSDFSFWKRIFLRKIAIIVDLLIYLNNETEIFLLNELNIKPDQIKCSIWLPHGPYITSFVDSDEPEDKYDYGFFGEIRAYKKISMNIQSILDMNGAVKVVVCGTIRSKSERIELDRLKKSHPNQLAVLEDVVNKTEFYTVIRQTKHILLFYGDGQLNTGIGNLSLSLGTMVIGSNNKANKQLQKDWGAEIVKLCDSIDEIFTITPKEKVPRNIFISAEILLRSKYSQSLVELKNIIQLICKN